MNSQLNNLQNKASYDLEERTSKFAENTINVLKKFKITSYNKSLIEQLIRSSSSIGANYSEANEAESKSDFVHKIGICKKETKETKYWINLLMNTFPENKSLLENLKTECHELLLIFSAIMKSSRLKKFPKL